MSEQKKSNLLIRIVNFMFPPKTKEQIAFEKKLKEENAKAYREAFLKESVKASKKRATNMAQQKFNPKLQQKQKENQAKAMDMLMRL